jgi:peptidase E
MEPDNPLLDLYVLNLAAPSHLSLFQGTNPDLESLILNQDVLYVGGGNEG